MQPWQGNLLTVTKQDVVDNFGNAIRNSRARLFIGSGLSSGKGRYPSWDGLFQGLRAQTGVPEMKDYPLLAQYLIGRLPNRKELNNALLGAFTLSVEPSETQRLLSRLPVDEWWTTNYDCLLEACLDDVAVVNLDMDMDTDKGTEVMQASPQWKRRLIKMHGSLTASNPPSWAFDPIISRSDYERYETDHPRLWSLLKATFLTAPFLFLGFGFQDPNIELMLKLSRSIPRKGAPDHFAIMPRPTRGEDENDQQFADRRTLEVLRMEDLTTSGIRVCLIDDFREIDEVLKSLIRLTRPPSIFVAGSIPKTNGGPEDQPTCFQKAARVAGKHLAEIPTTQLKSLRGEAGTEVSEAFAEKRREASKYSPEDITYYFRASSKDSDTQEAKAEYVLGLPSRTGTVIFTEYGSKTVLREKIITSCRIAILIGGDDGTEKEQQIATRNGIPVIPIPAGGGTAKKIYDQNKPEALLLDTCPSPAVLEAWEQLAAGETAIWASAFELLVRYIGHIEPSGPISTQPNQARIIGPQG